PPVPIFPLASILVFLFLVMMRRPPSLTLFPYTTLFRSLAGRSALSARDLAGQRFASVIIPEDFSKRLNQLIASDDGNGFAVTLRSEEHTSELQSHLNLVCRLLLEKKKVTRRSNRETTAT